MTTERPCSGLLPTLKEATRIARRLLPADGDPQSFLCNLSKQRGRRLELVEMELGGPSGMYIRLPSTDVVLVEINAAPSRRLVSIAHEAAHLLLGHDHDAVHVKSTFTALLPHLSPSLIQQTLLRHHHAGGQEREAEQLATVISLSLIHI